MGEEKWEDPGFLRVIRVVAPVHEDVLAAAMAVEIAEQLDFSFFLELEAHLFAGVNGWVQKSTRTLPPSV